MQRPKAQQFAACRQCFHFATAMTTSFTLISIMPYSMCSPLVCQVAPVTSPFAFCCNDATQQHQAIYKHQETTHTHYVFFQPLAGKLCCNMDYAPTSFWRWLSEASLPALKDAKEAIEREIANREDQEKQAFLQFWKNHPVPCNRGCRYYHGNQKCPFPCAHTSTDPDQWMHHSANEWHRCAAHWFL